MALFNKNTDTRPTFLFNHLDGLPSFALCEPMKVIFDTQRKELVMTDMKVNKISRLKFSQLCNVGIKKGQDIVLSEHDVASGALAGGLLFGSLGAIIGGMIGNNMKNIKKNVDCFIINYVPTSSPNEIRVISFEIPNESTEYASILWGNLRPYCKKTPPTSTSSYL